MRVKPELLAPAGTWESLVAAVENGADAVYLGGKMFNARHSADNFGRHELRQAVEFAHVRGVRVYVTVNTLLADQELPEAITFLHYLQQIGADAAIVQDLGLIRLARRILPELPLHASTQMTVHNLPTAQLLLEHGIERIVLAREMSLKAIKEITSWNGVEVEIFIHGALCICYSGQCLLSSLIGGRSGNRGRCAQPCRLNYVLVDGRNRPLAEPKVTGEHLLSPRDLNLSQYLPELCQAGVASLKIEGRMKRPEYVATVVRIYRQMLDRAAAGEAYAVTQEEAKDLAQIFNRDFTTGYLYNRPGREYMSYKRPNNRGVRLGRVKSFDKNKRMAELLLEQPLRVGDGIEVWITSGGRAAGEVGRILKWRDNAVQAAAAGELVYLDMPGRVFPGDRVFKTHDSLLLQQAKSTFTSDKWQKKIPLVFEVCAAVGEPLKLTVTDPSGNKGSAVTLSPGQPARKRPLTYEYLLQQLGRLGGTPFAIGKLICDLNGEVMVPVTEINEVRRQALAVLTQRRITAARQSSPISMADFQRRRAKAVVPPAVPQKGTVMPPALSVTVTDLDSLRAAVEEGADILYFGGEHYRSKEPISPEMIKAAAIICRKSGSRLILSAPRIMQGRELEWFNRQLSKISPGHLDGLQASSLGQLKLIKTLTDMPVYTDFSLNVFNRETAVFLQEAGVYQIALSPELTLEQVGFLAQSMPITIEVLVHGAIPLMVSEHCSVGSILGHAENCGQPCKNKCFGLRDRKDIVFPIEMDQFCRMHLFNSRDLCAIEDIAFLAGYGVGVLRIEARRSSPGYVRTVVRSYRTALEKLPRGLEKHEALQIKEKLAKHNPLGFTKGHFYRGVLAVDD